MVILVVEVYFLFLKLKKLKVDFCKFKIKNYLDKDNMKLLILVCFWDVVFGNIFLKRVCL